MAETHDAEIARRAVAIIRRIVDGGSWYGSAIELDTYAGLDGEDLLVEAKALLRDADITEDACESVVDSVARRADRKPRLEIEHESPIDSTYGGIFGGTPDTSRRIIPGLTRYLVDGKEVGRDEFLSLARQHGLDVNQPNSSVE